MKIAMFDTHPFERPFFDAANEASAHVITYLEPRLTSATAALAHDFDAVCSFANDRVDSDTVALLASAGVRLIALRSAGYNHVDLAAASRHGVRYHLTSRISNARGAKKYRRYDNYQHHGF